MPDRFHVVALISGGKDSLFSLLHCIQNGHQVVAIANLSPPGSQATHHQTQESDLAVLHNDNKETSDLNSFMYQTVGYSLVPLYSEALQLPLYRQQISGTSTQQSQYYDTSAKPVDGISASDETEDLIPLLRTVVNAHPEVNALSTGAILSTYQRTRIESIAIRLNLTPLSYLWQYPVLPPSVDTISPTSQGAPQRPDSLTGLLDDMALAGVDARIIKIASAGIPESAIFCNVADQRTRTRLANGLAQFFEDEDELGLRGAVLGEGGEYETLTLNGPRRVWKGGRISVDEDTTTSFTDGGVVYTSFGKAKVVPHDTASAVEDLPDAAREPRLVPFPALLDPQFTKIKQTLGSAIFDGIKDRSHDFRSAIPVELASDIDAAIPTTGIWETIQPQPLRLSVNLASYKITINNLTSASIASYLGLPSDSSVAMPDQPTSSASQLHVVLTHLPALLTRIAATSDSLSLSTNNISSTTLLLKNMADFAKINPVYSQIYPPGLPNPPARVTVAVSLPPGTEVSLTVVLDTCTTEYRKGLHVQGRSYWAPANIGPYSQAISVPLRTNAPQHGIRNSTITDTDNESSTNILEVVHIAGQIPLVPSSMEVYSSSFLDSAVLSLQHLWRIGQERGVDFWPWGVAYLASSDQLQMQDHIAILSAVWAQAHLSPTWTAHPQPGEAENDDEESSGDDPSIDIWDLQQNRSLHTGFRRATPTVGKHLRMLPNHTIYSQHTNSPPRLKSIPPLLAASVKALPRNVDIEWWSNGIGQIAKSFSSGPHSRPELHWHSRNFRWGTTSSLNVTPSLLRPSERVLFVTCLIAADDLGVDDPNSEIPTTLAALLSLMDESNDSNMSPTTPRIVQGITYITAQSRIISDESTLFATTTTIPCHALHGHGYNDGSKHEKIQPLVTAMLLRIEM